MMVIAPLRRSRPEFLFLVVGFRQNLNFSWILLAVLISLVEGLLGKIHFEGFFELEGASFKSFI